MWIGVDRKICEEAIIHYGMQQESVVCMEELAELQKEISKQIRGKGNKANLLEEIADVIISIELLKQMYGMTNGDISGAVRRKQSRTRMEIRREKMIRARRLGEMAEKREE